MRDKEISNTLEFNNVYGNGRVSLEFHIGGVAVVFHFDENQAVGCVLSPDDARKAAVEMVRLAKESENHMPQPLRK